MAGQVTDNEKMEGDLKKVLNPEGPLEIPVGGGRKAKVYWIRAGFGQRFYYMAEAKKELREAERLELISLTKVEKEILKGRMEKGVLVENADGKNQTFRLANSSIKEETLGVSIKGKPLQKNVNYFHNSGLLFFIVAPTTAPEASYEYYDEDLFGEITNNSANSVFVYLLARKMENHDEHYFRSPKDVRDSLTLEELVEILNKQLGLKDDDLKNLSSAPDGGGGKGSPKDTTSTPSEKKSGD